MRIVVAIGGNALLPGGGPPEARAQEARVAQVAPALGALAREHELIVVHGNGPQVGLLAWETAADRSLAEPYPLDGLVAETQGLIGYWLQRGIGSHAGGPVASLITQTLVDPGDPAFAHPAKPIGPACDAATAARFSAERGWTMRPDGGSWRRFVASPAPRGIVELELIRALLGAGSTVIAAGGGGIPVAEIGGARVGVEAVVDKDLAAGALAIELGADLLVILTDVPAVIRGYGTARAEPLGAVAPQDLEALDLPAGSMAPKVAAICGYVRATGNRGAIGSLAEIGAVVSGAAGTQVRPGAGPGPDRDSD